MLTSYTLFSIHKNTLNILSNFSNYCCFFDLFLRYKRDGIESRWKVQDIEPADVIRDNYRSIYFRYRVLLDYIKCELEGRASDIFSEKEINIFMKNTENFLEGIDECDTKNYS